MGDSIDEDPPEGLKGAALDGSEESARAVLTSWLDDFAAGRCEREDLEEAFMSVCGADSEASWDALALLDQYQRLGRVDVDLARGLKAKISQLAIGGPQAKRPPRTRDRVPTPQRTVPARANTTRSGADEAHTDDIDALGARAPMPSRQARPIAAQEVDDESEEIDEDDVDEEEPDEASQREPASAQPRAAPSSSVLMSRTPSESTVIRPARDVVTPPARSSRLARREPQLRTEAPTSPTRVLRGRYELLSVLARGNTSTVYKALDRHRANLAEDARYVAIKVLDANIDTRPDAKAQLEREFHQAQSLSHPNIASVFDLDRDGSTSFIVMELLEGDLLATVLRRLDGRPMQRTHALSLIASMGAALSYAHRRDIVHGDLKPRNVMITSSGEVRVLEFGFAHSRALQAGEIDSDHEVVAISAPAYASAERVHGFEPLPTDDVYSLACIAYELLSGRHPYGGRSGLLARAHGKRPLRIPGLNRRQWQALQRALVWERAERKIELPELLGALEAGESSIAIVPPELLSIPEDVGGRRRRMLGLAAIVVAVVAVGVYFVTRIPPPLQPLERAAASAESTERSPSADAAPSPAPADAMPTEEVVAPTVAAAGAAKTVPATPAPAAPSQSRPSAESAPPAAPASAPAPTRVASAGSATIQFAKDTYVVTESEPAAAIEVVRSGSLRQPVTFRWNVRGNSAEAGSDFAAIGPGVEQIPAGARSATILVPLINDSVVENTELFLVDLEVVSEGVSVGEISHVAVIIVDDD
jgi:serine/threonine protein kinase